MSRFIEVLNGLEEITPHIFEKVLDDLIVTMEAKRAHLEIRFPISCGRSLPSHGKFPL